MLDAASMWSDIKVLRIEDHKDLWEPDESITVSIDGGERMPLERLACALQSILMQATLDDRLINR